MKLEQNDKSILFATTQVPDIFFAEYLSNMTGDYLKIYLYLMFLAKYNGEININDLSKKTCPSNQYNKRRNEIFRKRKRRNRIIF